MTSWQFGRYEIKEEIGRGGMATVYLAYDPRFKRDVAIKVLPRQFTHDPMFLGRFEREAQAIASLEHPAIVPVYDFGESDELPYLVMRHMAGGSLAQRLAEGPLPTADVVEIIARIGSALDSAHERGLIHRDLKPANILFDHHGNAYLSDFGIVKLVEETATFTGSGIIGTPSYMSPEQVHGERTLTPQSDIYSLGIILFEMLTGDTPYHAETPTKQMMAHVLNPVPSILEVKGDLPPEFEEVIARVMAKEPSQRYASADELAKAVALAASDQELQQAPLVTMRSASREVLAKRVRRLPVWTWVVAGTLIAVVVVAGSIIYFTDGSNGAVSTTPLPQVAVSTAMVTETATRTVEPTNFATRTATATQSPSRTATRRASPTATRTSTVLVTAGVTTYRLQPRISANVRDGPGVAYPIMATVGPGQSVPVVARTANGLWYLIELSQGRLGWISAQVSELEDGALAEEIPTPATIPPTPIRTATPTSRPAPTNTPAPLPPPANTLAPPPPPTNTPAPPADTATPVPPPTNPPNPTP